MAHYGILNMNPKKGLLWSARVRGLWFVGVGFMDLRLGLMGIITGS